LLKFYRQWFVKFFPAAFSTSGTGQKTSLERGFVFLRGSGAAQAAQKNKTSLLMSHFGGEAAGKLHEVLIVNEDLK
jgi:hypothetical protein